MRHFWRIGMAAVLAAIVSLAGCDSFDGDDGETGPAGVTGAAGPAGPQGAAGTPAVDTGTISGTVTNSLSSEALVGVLVTGGGLSATTDENGAYTLAGVPIGPYDLTFSLTNFSSSSSSVNVTAGSSKTVSVRLAPIASVIVEVAAAASGEFGGDITLTASVQCFDGRTSCGTDYAWMQVSGPAATPAGSEDAASETYTLASEQAYKDALFQSILFDDAYIRRGSAVSDRILVHGINPFSLEDGIEVEFQVTATLDNGDVTTRTSTVAAPHFPYEVAPGLNNVPVDTVVVLHGPMSFSADVGGDGYTWTFTAVADGSALTSADISDATTQHAYFTPDAAGVYTLSVTDGTTTSTIDVTAGTFSGHITGIGADGLPESAACTECHGVLTVDRFDEWRESGHAHILTTNLNTSTYYGSRCFACHTVGYDPAATNGGIDEAADFDDWLNSGIFGVPSAENWATTVANYPASAQKANIQCENCHGPQSSDAHTTEDPEEFGDDLPNADRVSLSADVCATCHGEPRRHARFQQWQESGHNSMQHALRYGSADTLRPPSASSAGAGHCGRCHSSAGFRRWITQAATTDVIDLTGYVMGAGDETFGVASTDDYQAGLVAAGMTEQNAQPQTCATCHEVHDPGTKSGEPNDVKVRISGDRILELPAGFDVSGLGLGSLCIACHNSRNGAHNDIAQDWDADDPTGAPSTFMDDSTPHASAQGDVLMGESAFFVDIGQRSRHSYIEDSCATCHMELTPPPAELSYNLSGTNHSFEADGDICTNCHGDFTADGLNDVVESDLQVLEGLFDEVLLAEVRQYVSEAAAASGSVRLINDDCLDDILPGGMTDPDLLTEVSLGRGSSVTYDGTEYRVDMGETDACGPIGLVEYDNAGAATGLLFELPQDSGVYVGQALLKANWNIALIDDDGSYGAHNPSFVQEVLVRTEQVLESL